VPLYQFVCSECCRVSERLMPFSETDKTQFCEKCGGQLSLTPGAPAWFRSGLYGKQNGKPTEPDR
jgi:putative FmdB family regulatory protein